MNDHLSIDGRQRYTALLKEYSKPRHLTSMETHSAMRTPRSMVAPLHRMYVSKSTRRLIRNAILLAAIVAGIVYLCGCNSGGSPQPDLKRYAKQCETYDHLTDTQPYWEETCDSRGVCPDGWHFTLDKQIQAHLCSLTPSRRACGFVGGRSYVEIIHIVSSALGGPFYQSS
jgi:hypothetical protein